MIMQKCHDAWVLARLPTNPELRVHSPSEHISEKPKNASRYFGLQNCKKGSKAYVCYHQRRSPVPLEGCQRLARGEKVRSRPCAARGKQIPYQPRMTNYIQGCHRTHVQDPQSLGKRTASTDCHPRRTAISPSSKESPAMHR